ncbi:AAA family ATPase [Ensifer sp. NBAIM29]|nr:AAA family ATPase [Ensifer sp. NBAIM29]
MIIAGPGNGKTTVLVLRVLRHILVDQLPPQQILITALPSWRPGRYAAI